MVNENYDKSNIPNICLNFDNEKQSHPPKQNHHIHPFILKTIRCIPKKKYTSSIIRFNLYPEPSKNRHIGGYPFLPQEHANHGHHGKTPSSRFAPGL